MDSLLIPFLFVIQQHSNRRPCGMRRSRRARWRESGSSTGMATSVIYFQLPWNTSSGRPSRVRTHEFVLFHRGILHPCRCHGYDRRAEESTNRPAGKNVHITSGSSCLELRPVVLAAAVTVTIMPRRSGSVPRSVWQGMTLRIILCSYQYPFQEIKKPRSHWVTSTGSFSSTR